MTFGARLASGNVYSLTTMERAGAQAVIRTGFATILATFGRWSLIALAGGVVSTAPAMVGPFSGGGTLAYDRWGITGAIGVKAVSNGSQLAPAFECGLGKRF